MGFTDGIDRYRWFFEEYMNKDTIQDLREEINKMTALVNGFRKENEEFKTENARLYLENEKLKEENKKLRSDNCWITSEKKASKETNDMLAKRIVELKEKNTELATKNGELLKGTLETKGKNLNLMKMNEKLKEENKKLYLIIEKLERDNQETYDDYCEAKGENDELKEQVKCLAECCNKLNDGYCEAKEENEKLKERVKYLTDSCNKLNDEIGSLKKAKEVKVYKEFDTEEFFKRFGANMEISLSPYTEPSIAAYATDLNGVDLLRYSAGYTGRKFDDLFAPLYKYLASSPIERLVIAKELDKIREAYNNLEAKHNADSEQISKYDEDLRDWKRQAIINAGNHIKAKNTITALNLEIVKLKGGFKEKDKCIEKLRNELQKYEKSKPKQSEADDRWEWND